MDLQAIFDNYRRTLAEHYFDMNGRVGRGQFWYFILASFVAGLIVLILWSLVIDTVIQVVRAHRTHRPNLGLAPA